MYRQIAKTSGDLLRGGLRALAQKLDEIIEIVNSTQQLNGDTFLHVNHTPNVGVTINLDIAAVIARMPKGMNTGFIPVQIKKDGGVAGSMATSTSCTFTYSLFDLNGNALTNGSGANITGLTPDVPRYSNCAYDQPPDNSMGIAYRDSTGALKLLWAVKEKPTGATINLASTVGFNSGSGAWYYKTTPCLVLDKGNEGSENDYVTGSGCP